VLFIQAWEHSYSRRPRSWENVCRQRAFGCLELTDFNLLSFSQRFSSAQPTSYSALLVLARLRCVQFGVSMVSNLIPVGRVCYPARSACGRPAILLPLQFNYSAPVQQSNFHRRFCSNLYFLRDCPRPEREGRPDHDHATVAAMGSRAY
jgi:hypothetical protein